LAVDTKIKNKSDGTGGFKIKPEKVNDPQAVAKIEES